MHERIAERKRKKGLFAFALQELMKASDVFGDQGECNSRHKFDDIHTIVVEMPVALPATRVHSVLTMCGPVKCYHCRGAVEEVL